MPRPVEALPWGSRSMISTFSPTAASAVPRLMAVVVLPTPPFWWAIASTRGPAGGGAWLAAGSPWGLDDGAEGSDTRASLSAYARGASSGARQECARGDRPDWERHHSR